MATLISVKGMRTGYAEVLELVRSTGQEVDPRGKPTLELQAVTLELEDPLDALPLGTGRKLNPKIAVVEALQLIGAFSDPALTCLASPAFQEFREPEGHFHGAYGERVGAQVMHAVQKLRRDPGTRQAVVSLWNGHLDNISGKRDYPCTLSLTFQVRDGALQLLTYMRSNDAWRGLPYDLFQFTMLQRVVAGCLELPLGRYTHQVASLHLYEADLEASREVHAAQGTTIMVPDGFIGERSRTHANAEEPFLDCLQRARHLASSASGDDSSLTELERWCWERLHG